VNCSIMYLEEKYFIQALIVLDNHSKFDDLERYLKTKRLLTMIIMLRISSNFFLSLDLLILFLAFDYLSPRKIVLESLGVDKLQVDFLFGFFQGFRHGDNLIISDIGEVGLPDDAPAVDKDGSKVNRHESIVDNGTRSPQLD